MRRGGPVDRDAKVHAKRDLNGGRQPTMMAGRGIRGR